MDQLSLGVISRSRKENERRLAIHPRHLERIDADLRRPHLPRTRLRRAVRHLRRAAGAARRRAAHPRAAASRSATSSCCPSRWPQDLAELREGQVLWGWPHCVQDEELTQLAIDRRLTLIAFEAMNHWNRDGSFNLHVFHKNNELAGYCSVLHALQLIGIDRRLRPAAARGRHRLRRDRAGCGDGAQRARRARRRRPHPPRRRRGRLADPLGAHRALRARRADDPSRSHALHRRRPGAAGGVPRRARHHRQLRAAGHRRPADVPHRRRPGRASRRARLIIDVSCDEGMGFSWARPTTFAEPTFTVGDNVHYYAVDHSPSLPVELGHLGDQRGAAAATCARCSAAPTPGTPTNHPSGHRDPRRRHPEPRHPVLPAPLTGVPAPEQIGLLGTGHGSRRRSTHPPREWPAHRARKYPCSRCRRSVAWVLLHSVTAVTKSYFAAGDADPSGGPLTPDSGPNLSTPVSSRRPSTRVRATSRKVAESDQALRVTGPPTRDPVDVAADA